MDLKTRILRRIDNFRTGYLIIRRSYSVRMPAMIWSPRIHWTLAKRWAIKGLIRSTMCTHLRLLSSIQHSSISINRLTTLANLIPVSACKTSSKATIRRICAKRSKHHPPVEEPTLLFSSKAIIWRAKAWFRLQMVQKLETRRKTNRNLLHREGSVPLRSENLIPQAS